MASLYWIGPRGSSRYKDVVLPVYESPVYIRRSHDCLIFIMKTFMLRKTVIILRRALRSLSLWEDGCDCPSWTERSPCWPNYLFIRLLKLTTTKIHITDPLWGESTDLRKGGKPFHVITLRRIPPICTHIISMIDWISLFRHCWQLQKFI